MVFLEFGFHVKFVNLIMGCATIVSYSILMNDGLTPKFQANKGLRRGDPMSPYLFVFVMEYLNRSLRQLYSNSNFNLHPRCKKMNLIHICFSHDLLIFCRTHILQD